MTIKQACKIAHHCGLETVQEAVLNVELHASQMFLWAEINKELAELYKEAKAYQDDTSIYDIIGEWIPYETLD